VTEISICSFGPATSQLDQRLLWSHIGYTDVGQRNTLAPARNIRSRRNHRGASENYCSSRCARTAPPPCGTWARRSFLVRRNAARPLTAVDIRVPVARRLVGSCRVRARNGVWKYKGRPPAACPSSRWDRPVAAPSTRAPLSRQRAERRGGRAPRLMNEYFTNSHCGRSRYPFWRDDVSNPKAPHGRR
jgi:hypothetical protein